MTDRKLTPYDTGEVLEPFVHQPDPEFGRYGYVDFDNDEATTLMTVRAKPTQRGVELQIAPNFDGIVRVVVNRRVVDIATGT